MATGALVDTTESVWLPVPHGWSVIEDVGAVVCEAPAGQADITGRVAAAQMRIESGDRGTLVPRLVTSSRPLDLVSASQQLVADALAEDPTAVIVDARPWPVRTAYGVAGAAETVQGIRVDVAHHDMTTPMMTTTVIVEAKGGLTRVTASVPVAHHAALGTAVEQAIASLRVTGGAPPGAAGAQDLSRLDTGSWERRVFRPATVTMDITFFDVFLRSAHKMSPRWRPAALTAGLVEARGVATPVGHFVRRAVARPDRRLVLRVWESGGPLRAEVCVDVLEGRAVIRSTAPAHPAVAPGVVPIAPDGVDGPRGSVGLEVQDVSAVPARLAAWLGLGLAGPQGAFLLRPGLEAGGAVIQSIAPGVPAVARPFALDPSQGRPAELWARLVAQLA